MRVMVLGCVNETRGNPSGAKVKCRSAWKARQATRVGQDINDKTGGWETPCYPLRTEQENLQQGQQGVESGSIMSHR